MTITVRALACALFVVAPAAYAQNSSPIPAPLAVGNTDAAVLRTGTKVPLRMSQTLTTKGKQLRVGQHFNLEVAEAVLVNGQTVIPVGAPAVGEVTEVRNKGMWGKSGHLTAQVMYVTVNGRQIRLSGTFDDKGVTGTAGVVGAIAFVPVAGFFMTGTSAMIPTGAPVTAFIGEDVALAFNATAPAPMQVNVPAPAMPVQVQPALSPAVATKPAA
ncbi:hypothetical protein [Sphingomonas aerophila]|uniref:FecR protein domain-containing protein n=1 Tax=Sphingomonas aerophila TaxID=1344948 RepID=A0A7W9BG74_9SPHN|nr:hypothetical protein [Sphingomonas aerophila]MBB5716552.1 hypothetical protein [Sphingomonas aerophila]